MDHHPATSIDMSQARVVARVVPYLAAEMVDDQAQEESGEKKEQVLVVGNALHGMAGQRKLKKSLMRKWRTTGDRRKIAMKLRLKLLLHKMMLRWSSKGDCDVLSQRLVSDLFCIKMDNYLPFPVLNTLLCYY